MSILAACTAIDPFWGPCGSTVALAAVRGACVHEHVKDGWRCGGHSASPLINCLACKQAADPHVCPVTFREIEPHECNRCHQQFVGEPFRDPEQVKWLGIDGAATYCDETCFERYEEARERVLNA